MENQAVQNPTPEPTLTPVQGSEPKSRFPVMYLVLSLFVLVLLASTVFLYYQNMQLKNMLANYQTQPVVSPTPATYQSPIPSATTDPTANWKTYTDNTYKFSFKYPAAWKLNCTVPQNDNWLSRNICDITAPETILDHGEISKGSYFVVGVDKPNPNYTNFAEYINYSSKQYGYIYKDKSINNINGKIAEKDGVITNFLFESQGHIINTSWLNSKDSTTTDQILSTFKFSN